MVCSSVSCRRSPLIRNLLLCGDTLAHGRDGDNATFCATCLLDGAGQPTGAFSGPSDASRILRAVSPAPLWGCGKAKFFENNCHEPRPRGVFRSETDEKGAPPRPEVVSGRGGPARFKRSDAKPERR